MSASENIKSTVEEIKNIFVKNGITLAVAESLTCGNLQAQIGAVSGASGYFSGGITAYSIEEKVNLLQVDRKEARRTNCVSDKVAVEMAQGVANLFKSNFSISTTGYAEAYEDVKEPYAHFAIYWDDANFTNGIIKSGIIKGGKRNRAEVQTLVVETVLETLLQCLEKIYSDK